MEKKSKQNCCSKFQSAGLTSQTKFALILVSLLFIFLNVGSMILNIYLISSFTYKEIYKLIDLDEFNELTFAENNLENIQLQFENTFKNTLLSIVNLYKELSNQTLNNDFYNENNLNFNLSFWNETNYEPEYSPKYNMIFTCANNDAGCINIDSGNIYSFYSYLGIYLEKIFYNKRIFMNSNKYTQIMHLLIICDFDNKDNPGNNISFYYPGYTNEIKKLDINLIKEYVINKIIRKIKTIAMYKNILPNNLDFYDNLYLLPFYDDKDNDDYSFDGYNLTAEIFNEKFLNNNTDLKINEIAFMIVPKRDQENNEFLDISVENINENIGQIFLLIGFQGSSEIIFEKLNNQNSGLFLLRTNYLFPYELVSKGSCKKILNLGKKDEEKTPFDINSVNYLDDCLDKKTKIKKYKKRYSTYDKILEDFSIFRNNIGHNYSSNLVKLYKTIEEIYLQKNTTSFSKTITRVSSINNKNFKIKKTYNPLNVIYQINYFYPIDNIKMDILIKNEDYSNFILEETSKIMNRIIITGVLILIICAIILEIIILIILSYFTEELETPLNKIKNPLFITGQVKEEENENESENKNKSSNKEKQKTDKTDKTDKNDKSDKSDKKDKKDKGDKKIHIDEFKELIKSVSEALKSETEFKQKINKQEEDDMKLEMEYLNKEFEKNKIFNIMVDENKINNILEESNYSNEIIKHKTNIDNVKNDSFVKNSVLFREYVKIDEFEEFENSGENSMAKECNTIFKDDNTLQNPNSLFYDLFKTAYDENYVKKLEELKLKKENDKKKKSKLRFLNTMRGEDGERISKKSKRNILDFEKDYNDVLNEEEKKDKYKEENNINNINNENFEEKLNNNINNINNENLEENLNNNINNINNEEKLMKLYTEGNEDKEEIGLLKGNNNNQKDIFEE